MSKTILAKVNGWTPVIDAVVLDVGMTAAVVFGKAWRYCQMSDGVCKASQERIADELGISRATDNTYFSKLTEAGYLKDLTPHLLGLPHQYADTGKANLSISLTATCQNSLQGGVKNLDTKKEVKESIKEDERFATIAKELATLQRGGLKSTDAELINTWLEKHTDEWILKAIQTAKDNGANSANYADKILINWEANEYPKTRQQLVTERKSPNANKQRTPAQEPTDADRALAAQIKAERAAMQQL